MKKKFDEYLFQFSALIVLLSTALYFIAPDVVCYSFAVGAAGVAIARINARYDGDSLRICRLVRMQKFAPLFLVFASYLMFKPHMQWVPLVLAYCFIELYAMLMIVHEEKKQKH